MKADFLDAHDRHWKDAEFLFNRARWANADHLYGLAAECGLKRLMLAFNMPVASGIPKEKKDRVHADAIWARYESYRSGHHKGANYSLPVTDPFSNWDVSQRYANQINFTKTLVEPHRNGAEAVSDLIRKAILEGFVS